MDYKLYFVINSNYNQDLTMQNYYQIRERYLSFEQHFCNHTL